VRVADALNIRRHVLGDESPMSTSAAVAPRIHASSGGMRIRASSGHAHGHMHHVVVTRHRRHR
jgi:D-alanyl-D-alanine carboxypeptidase/D-alanyl-D-alanine endopeptidase (penicillin-binding protein 7)